MALTLLEFLSRVLNIGLILNLTLTVESHHPDMPYKNGGLDKMMKTFNDTNAFVLAHPYARVPETPEEQGAAVLMASVEEISNPVHVPNPISNAKPDANPNHNGRMPSPSTQA